MNEQNKKTKTPLEIFLIIVTLVLVIGLISTSLIARSNSKELKTIVDIVTSENKLNEFYEDCSESRRLYEKASEAYDINEYYYVISYCKESREYSSSCEYSIADLIVPLEIKPDVITTNYVSKLRAMRRIYSNLYEACEYFESAARAYDNDDYVSAGNNIELMNEKIAEHDKSVEDYQDYGARFNLELEKLLNN